MSATQLKCDMSTDNSPKSYEATSTVHPGLWLVATPIGNLDDISARAVSVLRASPIICCEDTRRSGSLLKHIGAHPQRLIVVNEHTEHDAVQEVLNFLAQDITVSLITDAGTPGISDPGEKIVAAAHEKGFRVSATPGPAAFVMAAAMSGLPTSRLAFDGFLPRSGATRRERLTELARERRTTVLYEAPHRLTKTVHDLADACGPQRRIVLARELSKLHEELWRGSLEEATNFVHTNEPRGEYVIVLAPAESGGVDVTDDEIRRELQARLSTGLSKRDAINEVTNALGVPRKRVYTLSLSL